MLNWIKHAVGWGLPCRFCYSHSHNASQTSQNARHAVQIVDTTGVLDAQAGCQDGLKCREMQSLFLQINGFAAAHPPYFKPSLMTQKGIFIFYYFIFLLESTPAKATGCFLVCTDLLVWPLTHTEELEAQGGDYASQKPDQHGSKRSNVQVSTGSHSNTSGQSGILDVDLQ